MSVKSVSLVFHFALNSAGITAHAIPKTSDIKNARIIVPASLTFPPKK